MKERAQNLRRNRTDGARSVVKSCENKADKRGEWVLDKKIRCGFNKASVAVANKNARIIWAILRTGECYRGSASYKTRAEK